MSSQATASPQRQLVFGPFVFDEASGELHKHGVRVRLEGQPLQILATLIRQPGKVVARDEFQQQLWKGGTFVDFDHGLNAAMNRLRQALGDSADQPRYIETLAGRGYRFVASVQAIVQKPLLVMTSAPVAPEVEPAAPASPVIAPTQRRRWPLWIVAAALAAGLVGWYMAASRSTSSGAPVDSLVVLPFLNLSANPDDEYFSDGLTEEITNILAHIGGLRVIARTSAFQFKGKALDIRAIGRQLHVSAVLEGSVRREPNRLRVTAHLNDVEGGFHIWSQTYDRDEGDTFKIQEDISRQIARKVRPNGISPPVFAGTTNLEAYNLYLKGRYYWNKGGAAGLKTAMDYLQRATAEDPGFALAWSSVADCYTSASDGFAPPRDALSKARATAQRALALDRDLGEAYVPLARVRAQYDWDWAGAERDFRQALQLNPGYASAHQKYGQYLAAMGRFDEAFAELKHAQELDPVSLHVQASVGRVYRWTRQYDKALEQLLVPLAMDSNYAYPHQYAGLAYMFESRFPEATAEFQVMLKLEGAHHPWALAYLGYTYALWGKRAEAEGIVQQLTELSKHSYLPAGAMAEVYAGLGDKDRAFYWLAKAVEERDTDVIILQVDPLFDPLRSDPRFAGVLRRVNFAP